MKKIIISTIAALSLTTAVYANSNTGCGLGSVLIKDQITCNASISSNYKWNIW